MILNVIDASADGDTLFLVAGEVDLSTAQLLCDAVKGAAAMPGSAVSLDMSGVAFMDCAGVAALVDIGDALSQLGIRLHIKSPSRAVERIIMLCGLRDYFCFVNPPGPVIAAASSPVNSLQRDVPAQRG